jgi:hypothetical protein
VVALQESPANGVAAELAASAPSDEHMADDDPVCFDRPLDIAVRQWHAALTAASVLSLKAGLKRMIAHGTIKIGSGFSGSEIQGVVVEALVDFWHYFYDLRPHIVVTFVCELDDKKRAWLMRRLPEVPYVFKDMNELSGTMAYNCVTQRREIIPHVDVYIGGFPCSSVSKLNPARGSNVGCVAKEAGSTGKGFAAVKGYVVSFKPKLVILENTPGLVLAQRLSGMRFTLRCRPRIQISSDSWVRSSLQVCFLGGGPHTLPS